MTLTHTTCEGTDELWVDEEGGFLLRHNVELACRAGDGRAWSTRQSIEVTGVGEEQAIARPEGAG